MVLHFSLLWALALALSACGGEASGPAQGVRGEAAQGGAGAAGAGAGGAGAGAAGVGAGGAGAGGAAGEGGSAGAAGEGGEAGAAEGPRLARSLELAEVALFQAVKVTLVRDGQEVTPRNAPVVAGREAVVRVYVRPGQGFVAKKFRAELLASAGGDLAVVAADERQISGASSDGEAGSAFSFELPAPLVVPGANFAVRVLDDEAPPAQAGEGEAARFPGGGAGAALGAAWPGVPLRVTLVPLRYDADGSGRLPDTSPAQIERFRALLRALYPVIHVELSVREPAPWSQGLTPSGNVKFGALNSLLVNLRAQDNAPDDAYYYGLISPAATLDDYCGTSCVTGQSFVVEDASDAASRVGSGMGFPGEDSAWTLAHELGHMHGRSHAPCEVSDPDPEFPYKKGSIGVWGRDERSQTLVDPGKAADLMGYCEPTWVSDYTFGALFERVRAVGKQGSSSGVLPLFFTLDEAADGALSRGEPVRRAALPPRRRAPVRWLGEGGVALGEGQGARVPLGHGGAVWVLDAPPPGAVELRVGAVSP